MEEINLQKIVTASIKIGTIATLKGLGLLSEIVIAADAQRGKYYFKRSELETASAMDALSNALPANKIFKNIF